MVLENSERVSGKYDVTWRLLSKVSMQSVNPREIVNDVRANERGRHRNFAARKTRSNDHAGYVPEPWQEVSSLTKI